ncbi:MAG: SDR family NAD(P)-dependent oxidoreductase, partial [bacterium]
MVRAGARCRPRRPRRRRPARRLHRAPADARRAGRRRAPRRPAGRLPRGEQPRARPRPWTVHLRGRLAESAPADDPIDLDALRARCPHRRPAAEVRAWHAERAIAYGPAWHGLGDVWFGEREIIASITTPPPLRGHRHGAHPAIVDTGLSALAALAAADDGKRTRVPIGAERVRLPPALPAEWVAHGRMRSETVADLTLYTPDGRWLGAINGLTLHAIERGAGDDPLRGAAWDVRWRRCDRRGAAELPTGAWLVLDAAEGPPIGRWLRDAGLDCRTAPSADVIGVIDARGLDARHVDDAGPVTARLLTLFRDLIAAEAALPGGLWVLTRGAASVGAELRPLALAQAPLIGLARTAATEHPELGVCLLDLDPDGAGEDPEALLAELAIGGRDGEVAGRREGRFVARLAPHPAPPPAPPGLPDTDAPFTLLTGEGGIDGLHFGVIERPPVDGDRVEVAVHATGLNFRDVLGALALYAGGPIPVGGEIAGVVTAVGPDVTRFAPGDPVLGLAAHAFSDRVLTAEALLAPKPAALSFERAAAVPLVWLTAWYGLFEIGGLRAGQRVLVHSAAGGVGLAAVELARAAGAEVIATASPAKWPLLRARGVERCFNSRTTDFGAAVAALGGVDLVLSALTLDGIRASFEALRPGGVLVDIGKTDPTAEPWFAAATDGRRYRPYDLGEHARSADGVHGPLAQIVGDLTAGRLRASPRAVFPIDRAVDAFRSMARGRHVGKIVVSQAARRRRLAGLPDRWPADRAVLVTGGLGGLGSALATWLVDRGARRLVLMSRRGADTPERRDAVAALEAAGAQITVVTADVADAEAVEAVMRRHRPMGVVHAAGVLADAPLARQTDAELAAVLAPKVRGAWNLHRATRDLDLDVFALFGSLSAVAGTPGQAAYAAANAFLARLAAHRRAEGLAATCIAWGPWAEVGMAARMSADRQAHMARKIEALSTARGLAAFGRVLDGDPTHVVVAPLRAESAPATPLYAELHAGARADAGLDADLAARLDALDPDAARALVRDEIAACVRRVVGLDPDA